MLRRATQRIDYKLLNSTGEIVAHVDEQTLSHQLSNMTLQGEPSSIPSELKVDILVLLEEIKDVIDENSVIESSQSELDSTMKRLEEFRTKLRRMSIILGTTDPNLQEDITNHLSLVKDYIKTAKDSRSKSRLREERKKQDLNVQKDRSIVFLIECIQRDLDEVEIFFQSDPTSASSDQLLKWRNDLLSVKKKLEKIASNYKEVLQSPVTDAERLGAIRDIAERYEKLSISNPIFTKALNEEVVRREVDKDLKFNKSQLNIKLECFTGYDSKSDIYTFQSDFEKIHLQSTPTRLLPDLLKNNFLADPALTLVKSLNDIASIWKRLKEAYGDSKVMLSKKLQKLNNIDLGKTYNAEKLTTGLCKLINMLRDLMKLALDHKIEEHLYYGDGLVKVYQLIGDRRTTKFLSTIYEENLQQKEVWEKLVLFLDKENKIHQQKILLNYKSDARRDENFPPKQLPPKKQSYVTPCYTTTQQGDSTCYFCGATDADHVATSGPGGSKIIQYFTCKEFVNTTPALRFKMLRDKNFCIQCLFPGADASSGKHAEGRCQRNFVCSHPTHSKYPVKKHILVCEEHKNDSNNQNLLNNYVQRFIRSPSLPDFSRNLSLTGSTSDCHKISNLQCNDRGIYLLQRILVDNQQLLVFFDNGCSDFVISKDAVNKLGSRCIKESSNPVILGGVGNCQTEARLGTYSVKLPLHDGRQISLSGVCLEQITSRMPEYPLEEVAKDIQTSYTKLGGSCQLPKLPNSIGGEVDLMVGVKYLRYHPKLVHQLSSGLALFESPFQDATGQRGVVGGPHRIFTSIHHKQSFNSTYHILRRNQQPDVPLLGFKEPSSLQPSEMSSEAFISNSMKVFEEVEATGSEISYRCPRCRSCHECKHAPNDIISVKEEVEQSLIDASVTIDFNTNVAKASLPFICDPITRLSNNKDKAMKVYQQQVKKLNHPSNNKDKQDVLASEEKLQKMGYVEYLRNLPKDTRSSLLLSKIKYVIPWRAVWKGNSISTPCRIVFDASQPTPSGYSLNDILAKGRNNLNKLQEVLVRWSVHSVAIHTDVRKMYNTIKLDEKDWCYQQYLWHPNLEVGKDPEVKVIKTLIYGVRSSGNQAEYALRKVADISKQEFPEANQIIQNDVYVDDCLTGEESQPVAHQRADELEVVLNRGGFALKGIAFSGEEPPQTLSDDGEMIHIAGLKWFVKSDEISLNISEMNFSKKVRGKKPSKASNIIPVNLTRRHCASKVSEIFDLTGKVSPLIASMKIDLQQLVHLNLDWDDTVPEHLRQLWESNFEMMKEIGNLRFKRAVIPEDAVSLEVNTLDFGDASHSMVCVAIYARFLRRNRSYSCQLILSRTRVVPKGFSQPRAELYASLINSHTGEVVKRSLKKWRSTLDRQRRKATETMG